MAKLDAGEFIPVGKISGVFGIKGWLKVFSFTEPRDNLISYSPLYMKRQGQWAEIEVTDGQLQGKALVMAIKNVTDRNQAMTLVGSELAIQRSQLDDAEDNEYYWAELVGMQVVNQQGQVLGMVEHLLETGANDVLVITTEEQPILVPFVMDEIVKQVDLDKRIISVDWQTDYL